MVGNGKNRIFLTSNEKFNTIRYNLKGLWKISFWSINSLQF